MFRRSGQMKIVRDFINSKAGHYLAIIKNEMMPFAALQCINLGTITGNEVSQTEKDKYDITCMQNLKNNTEEFI